MTWDSHSPATCGISSCSSFQKICLSQDARRFRGQPRLVGHSSLNFGNIDTFKESREEYRLAMRLSSAREISNRKLLLS